MNSLNGSFTIHTASQNMAWIAYRANTIRPMADASFTRNQAMSMMPMSLLKSSTKYALRIGLSTLLILYIYALPVMAHDKQPVALMIKGKIGDLTIVQPVFPTRYGIEQEDGPLPIFGELLNCKASNRTRKMVVDGKEGELREMVLDCGNGGKFVVRAIDFTGGAK